MHFTLCDMFSDLTQNAIEAGSTEIRVGLAEDEQYITLSIRDNGCGMTGEQLKKATDPFWTDGIKHPGRKLGFGIPFLIQTAEMTGGDWVIQSRRAGTTERTGSIPKAEGEDELAQGPSGTLLWCRFDLTHIDTPPVGDVTGYFRHVLTFDGRYELCIAHQYVKDGKSGSYTVRRSELLEALGLQEEGSFTDVSSLSLLASYLESLLEE